MRTGWLAVGVITAALAGSGCVVVNRITGISEAREIQAHGEEANAYVLAVWDTGMTLNDDPIVGLKVRVTRAWGEPYEATIPKSLVSRVHVPQVQPGQVVPVYVDRQNPARVALGLYDMTR